LRPLNTYDSYEDLSLLPVFFASTGLIVTLCILLYRRKNELQDLLHFIQTDRARVDPATRILVDLISDIANAAALSGDSQYMMVKRLNGILLSPRGESRIIKESFLILANLYAHGLLSQLALEHPGLNHNELVLCGMIMVRLDPVCISKVLGYDHEHTFYNKRADVRKKLGVAHHIPLDRYLDERVEKLRQEHDSFLRELIARY